MMSSNWLTRSLRLGFVGLLFTSVSVFAAPPTGRYKTIVDQMQVLHQKYPTSSSIFIMGQNDDGVDLYAMRIGTTPASVDTTKVGHLVVGTHHGNEVHAATFSVAFMVSLLKDYSSPVLFQTSLPDTQWTIVPVLNVSGYNATNRYEHGVDPNRDYPGPCISATGGQLKSIKTMIDFLASRIWTGSLTVHGYAGALTYPWGVDVPNTHTLDQNQFEKITAKAAGVAGYRYGTSTDVVYPCNGSFEDYTYFKHGTWSLLLELQDGSANDIAKTVEGTRQYFAQLDSSPSVKNQLTSSCQRSGRPDLHNE